LLEANGSFQRRQLLGDRGKTAEGLSMTRLREPNVEVRAEVEPAPGRRVHRGVKHIREDL
jgi:hypothetical protein